MKRVTENGKLRITEEGEVRMLESSAKDELIAQTVADAVALLRQQGKKPEARLKVEETVVTAFDGTKVRVTTEVVGTPK